MVHYKKHTWENMDLEKKLEQLNWILHQLQIVYRQDKDVFLLEHVIRYKDYARKDVEAWGKDEGCAALWNKIDDVLHVKLLEAVQEGKVDKAIAAKRLSAKYEYNDKVDHKVSGDLIVKIMKEGADL